MEPHESKTTSYCSESSYVSAGSSAIDSCKECVKVAVHIRPLIPSEKQQGCIECISVVPGLPQVQVGNHSFTFDHVYGNRGSPSSAIFQECVVPLVDGLFQGYNATVLAYGQTGSGKTYTMGTAYSLDENGEGVIPSVIDRIFKKVQELSAKAEILLKVSFIEILKEEVHDLLDPNSQVSTKSDGMGNGKAVQVKPPIQIRETPHGGITLTGVHEVDVRTQDEMASTLSQGSVNRATGSTNMNNQSSRSHAIFTIHMVNKRKWTAESGTPDDKCDDFVCAKLHLVDLAGSERAKRTGADGLRFKEGVHINKGLLALGNVISALGDEKKRKEGGHVPYRDSKLTRLLQDSLGGNSRTVMIACVSPADSNCEETLNTLKYANRARNIQNKAVINRDPLAAEMQRMRRQLEQVQAELLLTRAGGGISSEELQVLKHRISRLEEINAKLHEELQNCQVERDQLLLKLQKLRSGKSWEEIDNGEDTQNTDLIKGYVSRIRELENEIQQLQIAANLRRSRDNASRGFGECIDMEHNGGETFAEISNLHDIAMECGEAEEEENLKEREYSAVQDKMGKELQELDSQLEQKEAEMKLLTKGDTTLLKHFEKKVMELEEEKAALQREMDRLKVELEKSVSHGPGETSPEVQQYTLRLKTLEAQITDLKRKQENQAQLLKQKQKSEESAKRLQEEILRIKQHRVQLQHKMKQESEQFRAWKASREKELLQLKKEGRRNEYEMHKLQALNQRQKLVLQRKTEEAAMATKKLKELLESRKANARDGHSNGGYQTNERYLLSNLEHEMEVVFHVDEVRARVEKQRQMRAAMASELERLKQDSLNGNPDASSTVVNSRIALLEALLMKTSSNIVDMASQLSEAEERERAFTGKSRWKEVRTMNDAKVVMNYLFNKATTARSEMRRKDLEIGEMTETIGELRSLLGRMELEMQKQMSKLREQEARNRLSSIPVVSNQRDDFGAANNDNVPYDLRKPARTWYEQIAVLDGDEDMDISDGEDESDEDWRGEEDVVEEQDTAPRAAKKNKALKQTIKSQGEVPENNSKLEAPTCCGCGRGSGCKTTKCACRIAGQFCGPDCKCKVDKCTNREAGEFSAGSAFPQIKEEDGRAFTGTKVKLEDGTMNPDVAHKAETSKVKVECDESGNIDKDTIAEGAALLQNAFKDQFLGHNSKSDDNKQEETDDTKKRTRKPLSDIGNKNTKDDPKAKERRKWKKKATIQLVQTPATTEEPASATEEIAAASNLASNANVVPETTVTSTRPARPSEEIVQEPPLPIRLPRSMQRGAGTSPLRNRNFGVSEESGGDKSSNPPPSPSMILRGINGKENRKNR